MISFWPIDGDLEHPVDRLEGGLEVGPPVGQRQLGDLFLDLGEVGRRIADHDPGRLAHQDHADGVAPPRVLDELLGEGLGLVEPARPAGLVTHAQRAVEHQHPVGPPAGDHVAEALQERLGHRRDDQRMISVLTASSSHCSIRTRRWFLRIAAIRNCIAAQGISRNLRRFSRWIRIGTDAAARPVEQRRIGEAQGPDQGW